MTFPRADSAFRSAVENAAVRLESRVRDGFDPHGGVLELMQELLPLYPRLEIRQQDGLATYETEPRTWYVYRDGASHAR
jgi:hypothetical protein